MLKYISQFILLNAANTKITSKPAEEEEEEGNSLKNSCTLFLFRYSTIFSVTLMLTCFKLFKICG